MIRAVLLDLAGVVYQGEQPLPGEKPTTLKWIAFLRVKTEVTRPDLGDF